jgi:hypothetical protein
MEFFEELSKHLRYRTIDSVIGKRITITSLETLGQDLKEFLKIEIPYLGQIEDSAHQFSGDLPGFYLPYMKYRVLDLTFIPDRQIAEVDCPSADPSIISMLGFSDEDESWLNLYMDEIKREPPQFMVRLFLETQRQSFADFTSRFGCLVYEDELDKFIARTNRLISEKKLEGIIPQDEVIDDLPYAWQFECFIETIGVPQEMKINDACITNLRSCWAQRHFYS